DAQNGVIRFKEAGIRSYTGFEAPVIADINGDGSADILTLAYPSAESSGRSYGYLYAFEADGESWAPARPVWNQGMYYSLQINDDLTVPRRPISTLTKFISRRPGHTDILVEPYNVNWAQQPIVRENNYIPVLFTPDLSLERMEIVGVKSNPDSVIVRLTIENRGAASGNTNTPITFHMTLPGSTNKLNTYTTTLNLDIYPGERQNMVFTIPGAEAGKILHARLVDDAMTLFPAYGFMDCDPTNNASQTYLVAATDDYYVITDKNVMTFDVRQNDNAICHILPEIVKSPGYGYAEINADSLLTYVILEGYGVKDTLCYLIKCELNDVIVTDTAYVYFLIHDQLDDITDVHCSATHPPVTSWGIRETVLNNQVLIHNYAPLTVGDIDNDGTVDIIGYKDTTNNHTANGYESPGLKIFYFDAGANQVKLKKEFSFASSSGVTSATLGGAMAIARYNGQGYIVVAGTDRYLYAYDAQGGYLWKSDAQYRSTYGTILGIADFSNDGVPEVYTGNQIFSLTHGKKLCDGGTTLHSGVLPQGIGHSSAVADMDGDGTPEIIAGRNIYKVRITNNNGAAGNSIDTLPGWQFAGEGSATEDGATQVADLDNDGQMEVVVYSLNGSSIVLYAWKPVFGGRSYCLGSIRQPQAGVLHGIPAIGNIDNDAYPEIVYVENSGKIFMKAVKYNPSGTAGNKLRSKWVFPLTDDSGCTGATLFDFDQDGQAEIVYRNKTQLRIIDGRGSDTISTVYASFDNVQSTAFMEFPVIADVDNDGQAEIIVTGWDGMPNSVGGRSATAQNGYLRVFKANGSPWAPARTVWNQYGYNANYVNKDLTIPPYILSPSAAFPGPDGILSTADDIWPYNACRRQQSMLNRFGIPVWPAPDAIPQQTVKTSISNDTTSITVGISNTGDIAIGSPVYVTIYKDTVSGAVIAIDSLNGFIHPGDTGYVTIRVPDINRHLPFLNIIARINDRNGQFPYQPECDTSSSELTIRNPALSLLMKKNATLNSVQNNGYYSNPVSVLFNESVNYEITAVQASSHTGTMIVVDTLPEYLNYVAGTASPTTGFAGVRTGGTPARDVLTWTLTNVIPMNTSILKYEATPEKGVCASQPMFINRAWITLNDTLIVETGNSTCHQGAGAGVVTFSAARGGSIYNAEPQVLDYKTSAREGVLVVPDEGYVFSGWNHNDYVSLRGERVQACEGIMYYDTLPILGNIELTANFEPEEYPIYYYLNGGENADNNPSVYTVESDAFTLEAPRKAGDIFVGWTRSDDEEPQKTVTIPEGSTGELEFYANFLYSGREDISRRKVRKDKIWSSGDELYIRTAKAGGVVRVYKINGAHYKQHAIIVSGITKIKLEQGFYIVTLNNGTGQNIIIQ
ncbi:MAG: InlB B-repeat-containing protein, partial [Tannerella sp.]|nr:InlB B-repeat-containing protein [Tannerella sp.]